MTTAQLYLQQLCSKSSSQKYLTHHGIKGQKWGVKNGPPYPLGATIHKMVVRQGKTEDKDPVKQKHSVKKSTEKSLSDMTLGEIKGTHRAKIDQILHSGASQKDIDTELKIENSRYKRTLLEKEKIERAKFQESSESKSDRGKQIAQKVLLTAGAATVASLAAYGIYKYRKQLSSDSVKGLLSEPAPNFTTYKGKESWILEQVSKGLTGKAKMFSNGYEANDYYSSQFFNRGYWNSLSDSQRSAINSYSEYSYGPMNRILRGYSVSKNEQIKAENLIHDCTSALENSCFSEDVFVHRGVGRDSLNEILGVGTSDLKNSDFLGKLKESLFTEKGFFSSACSEDDVFGGVKMHVFCPKGTKGMYVVPISSHSGEHEFLLQRNSTFRILDLKTDGEGNITDIMMEVANQVLDDIL